MKKLFYIVTKSSWGGAQLYVYNLATNVRRDAFTVTVIAGGDGELFTRMKLVSIATLSLPYLDRDIKLSDDVRTYRGLVRLFKKEKPDIIHLNSSKIGVLGALAGRIAGVPKIIFTAHGWPFYEPRNLLWRTVITFASYLTVLLSTETIVIHQKDKSATSYWPFVQRKITLIYSGIGESFYFTKTEAKGKIAALIGVPMQFFEGKIILGNIAELHRNKGLLYAISAISLLPKNIIYIILGEGEQRVELEKLIQDKNLSDRVFLPGFVAFGSQVMKGFDIILFPSLKEGLPYTLLEAGLASLPVIATKVGGIPDLITDRVSGLLTNIKNSRSLSEGVLDLVENPQKRAKYGQSLKGTVLTSFDLKQMLKKTISLYLD
jgi:glycosyltransferase involved in cell wall biosynthesis